MAVAIADALSRRLLAALGARRGRATGSGGAAGHELRRTAAELAAGAPTDDALEAMRSRARSPGMDTLVAACLLQRRAGGDLARLLRDSARALEDQARLEDEVRAATAQARFTALIVVLLPLGGALLAELASPGWFAGLWSSFLTAWLVGIALVLQAVAAVLMNRMARGAVVTAALAFVAAASGAGGMLLVLRLGRPAPESGTGPRAAGPRLRRRCSATGVRPGRAPADLAPGSRRPAGRAGLGVREVMAAKVAAALLGGVAALPLAALAPGRLGLVVAPLAPAAGFLLPDLWLGRLAATAPGASAATSPHSSTSCG